MAFMLIAVLSSLLHLYIGWRIVPSWAGDPLAQRLIAAVLATSAALMPAGLFSRRLHSTRWVETLTWTGLIFMGLFSSLFVLTLLRDMALAVASILQMITHAWPGFDNASRITGRAAPVLALLITLWGFFNARRTAAVVNVDVPIAGLPAALDGFTIAQISDIHVGLTIRREYLDAIVQAVNRLGADMVAVTGDLVDGRVSELGSHVAPLASLSSRYGTYFVTGNHEYYSGAQAWVHELRRIGLCVLQNEHVVLRHGDASVLVAGVTDYSAHHFDPAERSDPEAAIAGAPADVGMKLLLAHQPRSADAAQRAGFQLQLSGHTHGGQFWPWNFFVRFQQPFTAGLHKLRDLWVYTSRGTGYWGPPKRLGAPSEITRLRLVPDRH